MTELCQVIELVNQAKKFYPDAPRTKVEVFPLPDGYLGKGYMESYKLVVSSQINCKIKLTYTVLHELCHTWFKLKHDENCHLMKDTLEGDEKLQDAWDAFEYYARKHRRKLNE